MTNPNTNSSKPGPIRHKLIIQEKLEIAAFLKKNPKESYAKVASIFSEKYGRKIEKSAIYRITKLMPELENLSTAKPNMYKPLKYKKMQIN